MSLVPAHAPSQDLFFHYVFNNFLHAQVEVCMSAMLSLAPPPNSSSETRGGNPVLKHVSAVPCRPPLPSGTTAGSGLGRRAGMVGRRRLRGCALCEAGPECSRPYPASLRCLLSEGLASLPWCAAWPTLPCLYSCCSTAAWWSGSSHPGRRMIVSSECLLPSCWGDRSRKTDLGWGSLGIQPGTTCGFALTQVRGWPKEGLHGPLDPGGQCLGAELGAGAKCRAAGAAAEG